MFPRSGAGLFAGGIHALLRILLVSAFISRGPVKSMHTHQSNHYKYSRLRRKIPIYTTIVFSTHIAFPTMAQTLPKTCKAAVVEAAGQPFVIKDVELRKPGPREVVVKVVACGVCHTDGIIQEGAFGDIYPRIPGGCNFDVETAM